MDKNKELIWAPRRIQKHMDNSLSDSYLREKTKSKPQGFKGLSNNKKKIIREQVANLPTGELAVVYLKFWEGLCEYEIAKSLHLSIGAVCNLLSSALERLKEPLAHELKIITDKQPECA